MAGDWIKFEHATLDKPEIFQIADILGIDPDLVVAKCLRFWVWADRQSIDGNALGVTSVTLNRLIGNAGFAEALQQVGWLVADGANLVLPHFDRHNGESAKSRANTQKRVKKHRQNGNGDSVTSETHPALPEKRREEDKRDLLPAPELGASLPLKVEARNGFSWGKPKPPQGEKSSMPEGRV